MPFTGRIGTQNSRLGDIVLGIVDSFDLPTVGFKVHVLSSDEVRVRFDRPVTDSALSLSSYVLAAITPGAAVPAVSSVDFYDADRLSVVVRTAIPLTFASTYSMTVVGVTGYDGEGVTGVSSNFTANVPDAPRAVGAFLSKRGMVDIVFDRPVGHTTPAGAAIIHAADLGGGVPMIFQPWAGESMPEDTLRFVYPNTTPLASAYEIDYSSIVDSSGNVGSGVVPLTLRLRSPGPYNSSSLSQMQFLDAYVSEIVPNVNAATVRVYFSGPALSNDVLNLGSWNITQGGPHPEPDTVNSVLVPDCVTIADAVNFLNAVRTTFAAHVLEVAVHRRLQPEVASALLATPVATDYVTANNVYLAARSAFIDHALEKVYHGNHRYPESAAPPNPPSFEDHAAFIVATNAFKYLYNQHMAEDRSLPYAGNYPLEIGYITNHATQSVSYPVTNDLTYFADVHVTTAVADLPVRVRGTVRSEDLGSSTSPADYTGDIEARAALTPAALLSKEVRLDREVLVSFDREVVVPDLSSVSVQNGAFGPVSSVRTVPTSTLPDAVWFHNSLVYAYSKHLEPPPSGAGHVTTENQFFVVPGDYMLTTDLPTLMYQANVLKMKYNGHVKNAAVHTNLDEKVTAADAFDFPSLMMLQAALRDAFQRHNSSGDFPFLAGPAPMFSGHHSTPGQLFLVTKLFSSLSVAFDGMLDSTEHRLTMKAADVKWDLLRARPTSSPFVVDTAFRGYATRPALASALPRPGLVFHEDREGRLSYSFETDSIEVYFSKRMHKTELNGGTGSAISVSGGSLVLKGADWVDERQASVRVVNMEQISYTLTASGLVDRAGNPIL